MIHDFIRKLKIIVIILIVSTIAQFCICKGLNFYSGVTALATIIAALVYYLLKKKEEKK